MSMTDEQQLELIVPLVVGRAAAIDTLLSGLGAQLATDAQTAFDQGIAQLQPAIETLLGHPLTADQLLAVRRTLADQFNKSLQTLRISA